MEKKQRIDTLAQTEAERILLAKVYDRLLGGWQRDIPAATGFLSRREQVLTEKLLPDVPIFFYGGLPEAERKLGCFLPDYFDREAFLAGEGSPLCAYRAVFYDQEVLSHRDFLGGLMGCGIKRETVGDIYVGQGTCDFLVLREVAPYLEQNFLSVGRAKIQLQPIGMDQLAPPEEKVKLIRDTVSSLRLDAVFASGFQISRGKAAEAISRGLVQRNWMPCEKPDQTVEKGDVISGRGFGKSALTEITGKTKKDRIGILISRYL